MHPPGIVRGQLIGTQLDFLATDTPPAYGGGMGVTLPYSLSPSKVSAFTDCALAFRFSAIDRLPEPPSPPATKGTLVHAVLEGLFGLPAPQRSMAAALTKLDEAFATLRIDPEYTDLGLDDVREQQFLDDAEALVRRYFELEDPTTIHPIGLELNLEVEINGLRLRGIINRLELDGHGRLIVTDYKTGKVPSENQERGRLGGVHFYAYLCEQLFGQRPAAVQLLYLVEPVAIITTPTEQSTRGLERKVNAVWSAVERACDRDDFRPKPSKLCDWCAFRAYCPSFGGDPDEGRAVAEQLRAERRSAAETARAEAVGQSALPLDVPA
jgi:putative RecB family exonuclease